MEKLDWKNGLITALLVLLLGTVMMALTGGEIHTTYKIQGNILNSTIQQSE